LIAAGHASGSISLWDSQGRLLRCWPAHYKKTAALAFSGDGAWLLSGGGDGGVSLWDVADVCDSSPDSSSRNAAPLRAWPSAHTLPVTCVAAGAGRVGPLAASASLDHSVALFAATAGAMLRRVQLGSPCRCLCLEGGEHSLFVGCEDGNIYEVDLVGGGGDDSGTASAEGVVLPPGALAAFSGHGGAVTCLASPPSSNSTLLISGSEDGTVRVWDAA
jgi:pre-rRNA-processing protein IPI3